MEEEMNTFIYAHGDCDGVMSAWIAKAVYKIPPEHVFFPTPAMYEVTDSVLGEILYEASIEKKDRGIRLVCVDVGCGVRSMECLSKYRHRFDEIVVIDHHPLKDKSVEIANRSGIKLIHDDGRCATLITYLTYSSKMDKNLRNFCEKLAVIASYADVQQDKPRTSSWLLEARDRHPELFMDRVFWSYEAKEEYLINYAAIIGSYFNTPHRMYYEKGSKAALLALDELYRVGDPSFIAVDLPSDMEVDYPYIAMLQRWRKEWVTKRKEAFREALHLRGDNFQILFIENPWNIGGYVAQTKKEKSPDMPCFVVNTGVPGDYAVISARGDGSVDLGRVFEEMDSITNGLITGGGHREAASGTVPKGVHMSTLMRVISEAIRRVSVQG